MCVECSPLDNSIYLKIGKYYMKSKIAIFGVGHLASFLVPQLEGGYITIGISRSFSNKTDSQIKFTIGEDINFKINPNVIVVNFPPSEKLIDTLKNINTHFDDKVPLMFVSSTSIYESGQVDEQSPLNKKSRLYDCEVLLKSFKRPTTVLRPGGLFDSKRHPGNFFRNKKEVSGGNQAVNMVHTNDVASFIKFIIDNNKYGENYNLVASTHPSKKEFYGAAMKKAGRPEPVWLQSDGSGKVVSNKKSRSANFKYKYDDLLLAIEAV